SGNLEITNYENDTKQKILMLGNIFNINYHTDLQLFKYGFSGQATRRFFNEKLLLSAGFRLDANNYNDKTAKLWQQFSPRLAVSYNVINNLNINAGVGRYFQQNAYTTLGYRNENNDLVNQEKANFIGVNQYNLGAERYWDDKVMLSVEGFFKEYFNYPIALSNGLSLANQGANYFVYGGDAVRFEGKGKTYGIEILNRWNYETWTLLASYTFFRSQFTNLDGKYTPSSWDSKHLFSITANKKLKKNWQIGAKWRYVGGLPYTPYDLELSANKEIWRINHGAVLDNTSLNSQRNKAFHQLDLRVDKHFFFKKWTLMAYFDIQNAYNFKSETPDIVVRKKNSDGTYQTTPDGKNYILESHKNTFGTVLPTLGIMVKF
ncbi:MAG: TonB-dependent receptor, partial [Flavobacteriaceae bacterium]|nr:TonB-dependent receptor [Flavobacteriaceae bacterium]